MLASAAVVEIKSRLGLLRRSPSFGFLFVATAGSSLGTWIAVIALTVDVTDRTGSPVWVSALLLADFLPIVLIGLLLGPLIDRLSRRRLMIASDLVRLGVFAALPFADSATTVVVLAAVAGVATGFFVPAVYAGVPNLVSDEDLPNATSLLQTFETLSWMIGPIVGGLLLTGWGPSVPYAVNAVTFLLSAMLVWRIPGEKLQSAESLTRGHWRDLSDGFRLVITARPLRTVLIVWSVVLVGAAAINVAEVFFAREVLDAGNLGFSAIIAASGVGLALGSFLAPAALGRVGIRRHYIGSIALMGVGWGGAALSPTIWVALPFVVGGAAGNGAAIVCNVLLAQRGAPDEYRGRAMATLMSASYGVQGLAMVAAGVLTDRFGARAIWIAAASIYIFASLVALVMTRWLPVATEKEREAFETSTESALAALAHAEASGPMGPAPRRAATSGLERIAALLEEVEQRRELEARRSAS